MTNKAIRYAPICLVMLLAGAITVQSQQMPLLDKEFDLAGEPSRETQVFSMESRLITYALDGSLVGTDVFRMHLKCVPSGVPGREADEYTCLRFTFEPEGGQEVSIPALEGWTYALDRRGIDEKGQVFGIGHARFEGLIDSTGNAVPIDKSYHVYNAFIDFHAFCNVFAEPASDGKGIQDLTRIGDKIVHAAAFSQAPTSLGGSFAEGSSFTNGEITLEFKGLGAANGRACALIEYDSGASSFKMIMQPMPEMEVVTVGSSHYWGHIYKDLETNWVQKVTMTEVVVSETTLPMPPNKMNAVIEREITILNVSHEGR
jgi:hypothetical protein